MQRFEMQQNAPFTQKYDGWQVYDNCCGEWKSVEAEGVFSEENCRIGIGLNMSYSGGYMCQLYRKQGKLQLLLLRHELSVVCVGQMSPEEEGISLEANKPFRLKMTCDSTEVTVSLEGRQVLCYRHLPDDAVFLQGECGFKLSPTLVSGSIRNFAAEGTASKCPPVPQPTLPEPYHYEMKVGDTVPKEWTKVKGETPFAAKDGALISGAQGKWASLLYRFDRDVDLRTVIRVKEMSGEGDFGFIFRRAPQTAYVRIGYNAQKQVWYAEDTPALHDCQSHIYESEIYPVETGKQMRAHICLKGTTALVEIEGKRVLSLSCLRHIGYGKSGVFADQTALEVSTFEGEFDSGLPSAAGAISYAVDEETFQGSMEVTPIDDRRLIGVSKKALYYSEDNGESFITAPPEYAGVDPKGFYQSMIRLRNGKLMQVVLHKGFEVQVSEDMKHWTRVGRVIPDELLPLAENQRLMTHVGSFTELQRADGGYRIFLPLQLNTCQKDRPDYYPKGHDAIVFYSDDEGKTWQHSHWVSKVLSNGNQLIDWSECKILPCSDSTLRMYCARNNSPYFSYLVSRDFGESWGEIGVIPEMQCARASYGVAEDPEERGTFYVAWVHGNAFYRGCAFDRTRLSLARTRDGIHWEFLTDVERSCHRIPDTAPIGTNPLFQIVDPCVRVDQNYVYVTWGGSMWAGARKIPSQRVMDDPSTLAGYHNELRPIFARFDKKELSAQPWSAATVSDLGLLKYDLTQEKW